MHITLTQLRKDLFKLVDQVIETGLPLEIERNGHTVKIILDEERSKLANLKPHSAIVGDPDQLIDMDIAEWREQKNL